MVQKARDAVRWKGRAISRELLGQYVHSTSRHLKEFGLRPGSPVAIKAALSPSYVIVLLSLWRLGIVPYLVEGPLADFKKGPDGLLVLVDEQEGVFRREMLLSDMVTLEIVEGFLSAAPMDDPARDPASLAAILVSMDGQEEPVTFGGLVPDGQENQTPGETVMSAPISRRSGLALFYRAMVSGSTVMI